MRNELDKVRARYNAANVGEALADEATAWLYALATGYEDSEVMGGMAEAFPTMEGFAALSGHGRAVFPSR